MKNNKTMSVQRTPPPQSLKTDSNLENTSTPQLSSDPSHQTTNSSEGLPTATKISQGNKRYRKESSSPNQSTVYKDELKDLICAQGKELADITTKLQVIAESNARIDAAVSLLTTQNEEFRQKIAHLEKQAQKQQEYISVLEDKVEDLQRSSRKSCVEIKNVPKKSHETREDLVQMVTHLSNSIQLNMNDRDINDIFRLKSRGDEEKNSTIVVELRSTILRSDFLKKAKDFNFKNKTRLQAKHLGFKTSEDCPIFISEQLTPKGARLFFLARDLRKAQKVKYCWTSMGKVLVRKDDTSRIIHIQHEAQVQKLMNEE